MQRVRQRVLYRRAEFPVRTAPTCPTAFSCRRAASQAAQHPPRLGGRTSLRGFTLVELLVVIAIIGILVALLLPAVQAAREAARRSTCQNNVKQLITGMHLFVDSNKTFPAGLEPAYTGVAATDFRHSWVPYILPYIEEQAIHDQYQFDKRWMDPQTNSYLTRRPGSAVDFALLLCPSVQHELKAMLDYAAIVGPGNIDLDGDGTISDNEQWCKGQNWSLGVLIAVPAAVTGGDCPTAPVELRPRNSRIKVAQIGDGTTYTVLLGECSGRDVNTLSGDPDPHGFWGDGDHAFAHHGDSVNITPQDELFSTHPNGLHLGMADGSVQFLRDDIAKRVIDAFSTRDLGESYHGEM